MSLNYEVQNPLGLRVKAYRNLHTDKISLMDNKGRVIKHVSRVLIQVEKFHVRVNGMLKVVTAIRQGRKSAKAPHAFVIGMVVAVDDDFEVVSGKGARYNPAHGLPHFVTLDGQPLFGTEFAVVEALPGKKSNLLYDVHAKLKGHTPIDYLFRDIMWPHELLRELNFH